MKNEYEAKFLNINPKELSVLLTANGFQEEEARYLYKRIIFKIQNDNENKWVRLRDEGNKITLATKQINAATIDGLKETEIIVNSFDDTVDFLESINLIRKSYQENYRSKWKKNTIMVTIDEWPSLMPYCEIEAPTPELVELAAKSLGFNWEYAFFGTPDLVYEKELGIQPSFINNISVLDFNTKLI